MKGEPQEEGLYEEHPVEKPKFVLEPAVLGLLGVALVTS
jgi:hypothetical protein